MSSYILDTMNVDEVSVAVVRRPGRDRHRRAGDEPRAALRRQQVPRPGVLQHRGRLVARRQPRRRAARRRHHRDARASSSAYDASVSLGGPIKRDRLWFFGSYRKLNTDDGRRGDRRQRERRRPVALGLGRPTTASRRARSQGRDDVHRPRSRRRSTAKHRVTFSHEYQHRCEGSTLKLETDGGCHTRGDDWIASAGATTVARSQRPPTSTSRTTLTQATVDGAVTNKLLLEAGFSRLRTITRAARASCRRTASSTSGDRAVDGDQPGDGPAVRAARELRLPRLSQYSDNYEQPEQLARLGVVRHRRAQHEGRLPGRATPGQRDAIACATRRCWPTASTTACRTSSAFRLPGLADGRSHVDGGVLRPGHVDARPADAAGRAALRPRLELQPGRAATAPTATSRSTRRRSRSSGRRASTPSTTSRRASASPTTCSATARRRSSSTSATTSTPRPTTAPTRATTRPTASCSTPRPQLDGRQQQLRRRLRPAELRAQTADGDVRRADRQRPELRQASGNRRRRSTRTC